MDAEGADQYDFFIIKVCSDENYNNYNQFAIMLMIKSK